MEFEVAIFLYCCARGVQDGNLGVSEMSAPSMKERKACWGARDIYWKCLDENMKDTSKCDNLRCSFENLCPQQWVKYFNKRRDYLQYKAQMESGQFLPSEKTEKS
ncbi:cytochrome c oxidase assembly factor 6 homolog isoform 1-T1 [Vipera latastei]